MHLAAHLAATCSLEAKKSELQSHCDNEIVKPGDLTSVLELYRAGRGGAAVSGAKNIGVADALAFSAWDVGRGGSDVFRAAERNGVKMRSDFMFTSSL